MRTRENVEMRDERLRSEIREEQERIISAVRSAGDHWEMAKAEDSFARFVLERMADELEMELGARSWPFSSRGTGASTDRRRSTSAGM